MVRTVAASITEKVAKVVDAYARIINCRGPKELAERLRREGYASYTWQNLKRRLADIVAEELVNIIGPENVLGVYYTDLHGGELVVVGHPGGKDIDVILWVTPDLVIREEILERKLEEVMAKALREVLGEDVRKLLGIPNIVEVHVVRDLRRDMLAHLISSSTTSAIPLWTRSEGCEGEEDKR